MRLTWDEIALAAKVGVEMRVSNLSKGRSFEGGRGDLGFDRHVQGELGALAVAKELGLDYAPVIGELDTYTGDLAGLQVKTTTIGSGSLIVRPHDPEEFPYVFAVIALPDVHVRGWMLGSEAKAPAYWREAGGGIHRAAYFVPQQALNPMAWLVDQLAPR